MTTAHLLAAWRALGCDCQDPGTVKCREALTNGIRGPVQQEANALADALEFALSEESGFACPAATEERMRAALRAAGRLP